MAAKKTPLDLDPVIDEFGTPDEFDVQIEPNDLGDVDDDAGEDDDMEDSEVE